jgi:hypothetical protein
MNADAALQPDVYTGRRVVDVATAQADERDREFAHVLLTSPPLGRGTRARGRGRRRARSIR